MKSGSIQNVKKEESSASQPDTGKSFTSGADMVDNLSAVKYDLNSDRLQSEFSGDAITVVKKKRQ